MGSGGVRERILVDCDWCLVPGLRAVVRTRAGLRAVRPFPACVPPVCILLSVRALYREIL